VNREKIQKNLDAINKSIVKNSPILETMKKNLQLATADKNSIVEISPLTKDIESLYKDIESLYKGMNIYYGNKEALPISVENLGMGIRSWAVFSTIKTNINYQTEKFKNVDKAFYPLLLVEEPEAHIHPQARYA